MESLTYFAINHQMASSYPPPPNPDQQSYNPYQHAAAISSSQLQEAVEAAGVAVQSVQTDQPQDEQSHTLPYTFPRVDPTNSEASYSSGAVTGHAHRQGGQGDAAHQRANRLRKACDSCSIRKVKCDESGPPCKACASLEIPCTFDRPSRRRGPPNRHAEAIKKRRTDVPGNQELSSPSSPTHAAQALAALSAAPQLSAEAICQMSSLEHLVDDFFIFVYPLCPFPHDPSFRESLRRRDDYSNRSFVALVAAMIGALVASYPRKPRLRLHKPHNRDPMFPNHIVLAYRCQRVCLSARGEGYMFKDDLSVYDAATSYFLGLSYLYTGQIIRSQVAFRECLTILDTLKPWRHQDGNDEFDRTSTMSQDFISVEMGKRIFWTLWSTLQSLQVSDASFADLSIRQESETYRYPPLPLERDDHRIHSAFAEEQPVNEVDLITAFNSRILTQRSADLDSRSYLSKDHLAQALEQCKAVLAGLPPQLAMQSAKAENGVLKTENDYDAPRDPALMVPSDDERDPHYRYSLQQKSQSRDLFVNQLGIRIRIIQGYNNLSEGSDPTPPTAQSKDPADLARVAAAGLNGMMQGRHRGQTQENGSFANYHNDYDDVIDNEQDTLVRDLLSALADVAFVNIDPLDDHYVSALRNLSYLLLSPHFVRRRPLLEEALPYLQNLLQALDQLEQTAVLTQESEAVSMQMAADLDPEIERRCWEDIDRARASFKAIATKE